LTPHFFLSFSKLEVEEDKNENPFIEQWPDALQTLNPDDLPMRFAQENISHMFFIAHDSRKPSGLGEADESFDVGMENSSVLARVVAGGRALEDDRRKRFIWSFLN
jgi:hypothetical protein